MATLGADEVQAAAHRLGWDVRDGRLARTVEREDFVGSMQVVNAVAELAEAAHHHPDIAISWNRVELTLWTHSAGGVTGADVEMAAAIEGLLGRP